MDDPTAGLICFLRLLEQKKKDCCISTASEEGLRDLCLLIGLNPEKDQNYVQDPGSSEA